MQPKQLATSKNYFLMVWAKDPAKPQKGSF